MGFLDNSGDIILDAVLTDHGRKMLAKGDGSFEITKFALGDEEIDYSLYDVTNTNGSAYYDLQILQTPILEAFTDNAVSMKSKLMTIENEDLLFLPIVKLNEIADNSTTSLHSVGAFVVAVNQRTEGDTSGNSDKVGIGISSTTNQTVTGVLFGVNSSQGGRIRVDQGLDTDAIPPSEGPLGNSQNANTSDLRETAYTIQIDNRFGSILTKDGNSISHDYVDDDNIAYYTATQDEITVFANNDTDSPGVGQVIQGPRGTYLEFKISSSNNLRQSEYLFTQLGSTSNMDNQAGGTSVVYHIDTLVRVTGQNTGYSIDIPVRFVKFKQTL